MRTTITLDPDVDARLRRLMQEKGVTFREAVNSVLRAGLGPDPAGEPFRTPTYDLGSPTQSLDKALELAGRLEDEALHNKMALNK